MPGFGKAGISFLTCIRLSFALIVQGLAKKYRSEARMIFSANQSEGPPCTIRGKDVYKRQPEQPESQEWFKIHIRKNTRSDEDMYTGEISCKDEDGLKQFVNDHEGFIFVEEDSQEMVILCFRHSDMRICLLYTSDVYKRQGWNGSRNA